MGSPPDGCVVEDVPESLARADGRDRVEVLVPETLQGLDLAALPALRLVQTRSAGIDWIVDRIPDGVTLCDASGARDAAMSEWVIGAILADHKRARKCAELQAAHRWEHVDDLLDLADASVLILGYGSIGRAVERRLIPFGTKIVRVGRTARDGVHPSSELSQLLPAADVVVNLLPLTNETRGLIGSELLALIRDDGLFVNAGRGATVDTDCLVAELRAKRIRAVLDVVEPEPLPAEHPLWASPGVLISSHSAGDTLGADRAAWRLVGRQLHRYANGASRRHGTACHEIDLSSTWRVEPRGAPAGQNRRRSRIHAPWPTPG
jgi:phosphoglycerate dehydrogenase-like enzyme